MSRRQQWGSVCAFVAAGCVGAAAGYTAVRRLGLAELARQSVSSRGGNALLFSGMKLLIRAIFGVLGPLRVSGEENVPPEGGVVIAPNHLSNADVHALYAALPRWAWFVGTVEIFDIPVMGPLIKYYHAFPIRREGTPDRAAMRRIMDLLSDGEVVVIFPEGREAEDLVLQDFEEGTAMMALRTGAVVVPTAIVGTERILPYGQNMPRYSGEPVTVRFGPPVSLAGLPDDDRHARLAEATRRIRQGVAALLREMAPERVPAAER